MFPFPTGCGEVNLLVNFEVHEVQFVCEVHAPQFVCSLHPFGVPYRAGEFEISILANNFFSFHPFDLILTLSRAQ